MAIAGPIRCEKDLSIRAGVIESLKMLKDQLTRREVLAGMAAASLLPVRLQSETHDSALCFMRAVEMQARGEMLGPLHGLPVAHKDLIETRGIRTTYGSPSFKDYIPAEDDLVVARMKRAGAITVGKTNTPEFGAGSQTFNSVFGATRNPYD